MVLFASIAAFVGGVVTGAWTYSTFVVYTHSARLGLAAESAETTFLLYTYAPPAVVRRALTKHADLIGEIIEGCRDGRERESFLKELAVTTGRLALLEEKEGDARKAATLMASAMGYLKASGSTWTEEDLVKFIVRLDETKVTVPKVTVPGFRKLGS